MIEVDIRHRLPGFDLAVEFQAPAGVTAIYGPSGAGKTTLIKSIAGLIRPDQGRVRVGETWLEDSAKGLRLPPHKRRIGYVFQEPRLFPHMSVARNLTYGHRSATSQALERIATLLGIDALMDRHPAHLSGGEAQRVAIGRALLRAPDLLIFDEPMANLDEARKAEILPYVERLRDEARLAMLYVSHAVPEIARLATHVVRIDAGRVQASTEIGAFFTDPDHVSLIATRDLGAVIEARLAAQDRFGLSELATSAGRLFLPKIAAAPGTVLRVRIEARDVMLSRSRPSEISALNVLPVRITTISDLPSDQGPSCLLHLRSGDDLLQARVTQRSRHDMALAPGWAGFAVIKSVALPAAVIRS